MIEYHEKSCVTKNHHVVIKHGNKHGNNIIITYLRKELSIFIGVNLQVEEL